MKDSITISFPPYKEFIPLARYAVSVFCNRYNFDLEKTEDMRLVVSEACNNSIAYGDKEKNFIDLKIYKKEDCFQIHIKDKGYGFDLDKFKKPNLSDPCGHGLGIHIINSLVDSFEKVENDKEGTTLILEIKCSD